MSNLLYAKSFANQSGLTVDNISTTTINNITYNTNLSDVSGYITNLYSTVGKQSNYLNTLSSKIYTINNGTFGTITATGLITNSIISSGTNGPLVIDPNYSTNNHVLIYDKLMVSGPIDCSTTVSCIDCNASSWLRCTALDMQGGNLNSVGGIYYSSDDRLKNNESVITGATEILLQIRGEIYDKYSNFDLSGSFTRESGLIAQELYNISELRHIVHIPTDTSGNLITTQSTNPNDDPNYNPNWGSTPASVNYTMLIPYLIRGFQEQHALIESLNARIVALENP